MKSASYNSPEWFLSSINIEKKQFKFHKIEENKFLNAPFHDGRAKVTDDGDKKTASFNQVISLDTASKGLNEQPNRIILHQSFCGSTLLARSLQKLNSIVVYREPQVFVELSTLRSLYGNISTPYCSDKTMFEFILSQYKKTWLQNKQTIIKPSNWANDLFKFCDNASNVKIIILPISQLDYFVANIRGGKERIKYSLNLLNHLLRFDRRLVPHVHEIKSSGEFNPVEKLLLMLAVVHHLQIRVFQNIIKNNLPENVLVLPERWLDNGAKQTILNCSNFFALARGHNKTVKRLDAILNKNAKSANNKPFDSDSQTKQNDKIMDSFETPIIKARAWAEKQKLESRLVTV